MVKIFEKIKNKDSVMILLHGRGSNAQDMLNFTQETFPDINTIALEAESSSWYPYPFMTPREKNEPFLTKALDSIKQVIANLEKKGFEKEKIILLGFSQGACLASEYLARNPENLGAVIIFSGGLIGEKIIPPKNFLEKTKILISGSKNDPFIPLERLQETSKIFKQNKANVTEFFYEGESHTITGKEIQILKDIISKI